MRVFLGLTWLVLLGQSAHAAGDEPSAAGFDAIPAALSRESGWASELGIDPRSVYVLVTGSPADFPRKTSWQLVFVMRSVTPQN